MFLAYKDVLMIDDSELYAAFEQCKRLGAIAQVHAENGSIIAEVSISVICLSNSISGVCGSGFCRALCQIKN